MARPASLPITTIHLITPVTRVDFFSPGKFAPSSVKNCHEVAKAEEALRHNTLNYLC